MDEPTNDLDVTTLAILEDYLDSFDANNSEAAKNQQGENTQV